MLSSVLKRRQFLSFSYVIVKQLGIEPACLGKLYNRIDRAGLLPVNQSGRLPSPTDNVPRTCIAVADNAGYAYLAAKPRPPLSIYAVIKRAGGFM